MQFAILHTISYQYSRDVFLEPHEVRMQPRNCGVQSLQQFELDVDPLPAGVAHCIDAEGNNFVSLWFDGLHSEFRVTARSRVQCTRHNPYDYLLRTSDCRLPPKYASETGKLLRPAIQPPGDSRQQGRVQSFAEELSRQSDGQLQAFLDLLNSRLYTDFESIHRAEGRPWPAAYTLNTRHGACRDLAVLFAAACRSVGLAARFVSGYQAGDDGEKQRDLHAWAEVFVPGAGWRGYDPTHGLAVSDRHVAVAASASSDLAAPLIGSFRGDRATVRMTAAIDLQISDSRQPDPCAQQQHQG